ncbi:uncharacterized protein [Leptinotarsa decemlineata]|uniref:uncharacterized protein n=1 Tax=Leptinotarsa decemlineata TaxID=7539 RepID=UPI003D308333
MFPDDESVASDSVTMGNPLSTVIAKYFMEGFEEKAIDTFELKPTLWLRYMDDIFVILSQSRDALNLFVDHSSIKFTMETEQEQRIAFPDVLIERCSDRLTYKVYRKPTQ